MRRLIVLAAVVALISTACKLETNFGATIEADGSGTIIMEFGMDDEAAELLLQGGDPFEDMDVADAPGSRTREERRGDMTFYVAEVDVDDVTAMESQLLDSSDSLLEGLTVEVTDDLVSISGSASAEDTLGSDAEGFDPGLIEDSFSASVFFTMPGAITSHNADRQDGNTLYWDVPVFGGSLDIEAQSDPTGTPASSGGGFPVWGWVILAGIVLGGLWYFMQGRQSGGAPAPADPADPGAATPPPPPAEPPVPPADTPPAPPPAE